MQNIKYFYCKLESLSDSTVLNVDFYGRLNLLADKGTGNMIVTALVQGGTERVSALAWSSTTCSAKSCVFFKLSIML
jgi:hypothetical protein